MHSRHLLAALILAASLPSATSFASDDLDPNSQEAAMRTDQLLRDPNARQELFQKDAKARAADEQVRSMTGSDENMQALYELAAEVFGSLVKEANGDPNKMLQLLQQAQSNPEKFAKQFTPEQRAKLEALSKKMTPKP